MSFDYFSYVDGFGGVISKFEDKFIIVDYDGFSFKLYKDKIRKSKATPSVSNCLNKVDYFRKIVVSDKHPNLRFDKYVFSGMKIKSVVTCVEHGDFYADPYRLLYLESGCRKCYDKYFKVSVKRKTLDQFVSESKCKFGDKFDYSLSIYVNTMTPIKLVCPEHGEFFQTPNEHLQSITGCTKCGRELSSGYSMSDYVKVCGGAGSHLYIHKMNDGNSDFYKIGISKSPMKRLKDLKRSGLFFVSGYSYFMEDVELVWSMEKDLHRIFKSHKYLPHIRFRGYTECFNCDCLDDVLDYINSILNIKRGRYTIDQN